VAIGKPFHNKKLYAWIQSIREKTGGQMIPPNLALKQGLKSLKAGRFLGIVGDQGRPESNYAFAFFGRRAFTSTAPALLAYKTNSPILVATTVRKKGRYYIRYSDPIFPNLQAPLEKEVPRLMDHCLALFQASVQKNPDQWLWLHNRYKQQTLQTLYRDYRFDCIGLVLPEEPEKIERLLEPLKILKQIYDKAFLILFMPEKYRHLNPIEVEELIPYATLKKPLKKEYRCKLVFNFTENESLSKHFLKLSALKVLTLPELKNIALRHYPKQAFCLENPAEIFLKALCRPDQEPKMSPPGPKSFFPTAAAGAKSRPPAPALKSN
jgi:KDO2-lipid IV(A) lauroyltransferase